jgi:uncharacterized surface protein with fasciclin (FAS1) repeats
MKRKYTGTTMRVRLFMMLTLMLTVFSSCRDDYFYDDTLPEWLGASIYDYLQEEGKYTTYIRMIDDLKYTETLSLTGSKTLFVASDSAFTEFYKNNEWGVRKYEDFSLAQKKLILNFSLINNAYLIETLSNYYDGSTYHEGTAMRRPTTLAAIDSIAFEQGDKLSIGKHFDSRREQGMYLLKDATVSPTVYFTQKFLTRSGITNEDMDYISGAVFSGKKSREDGDVHVFDTKVIKRDIVCKNGYVHVLEKVLIPPVNMAVRIEMNPETKIFSKLLERFAAPYYDAAINSQYRQLYPNFTDSIFEKLYFSSKGGATALPSGLVAISTLLPFSPGWNSYSTTGSQAALPADMATMFVPTDAAMNEYFNSGVGELLKGRFGSWDSVPDNIIIPLLRRHMRPSLIESVPSRFSKIVDDENYAVPIEKSHVTGSYTGVNGQIFYTNKVYPPRDYISVYSPILLSENTKIMNWAIRISETSVDGTLFEFYKLYLNSLVSNYSVFIPTDEYFEHYVDPIAYGQDVPAVLKFKYVEETNSIMAYIHKYDKENDIAEAEPIDSISSRNYPNFIKNRLWDVLDSHIVIGNITTQKQYYVTKANDIIRIDGNESNMTVSGGRNMHMGTTSKVTRIFEQQNGKTYFIDNSIQPALRSLYTTLSSNPEYEAFFELLSNVPADYTMQIFSIQGVDQVVKFFNAYRYTVYAPTNAAIRDAYDSGRLRTWDEIDALTGTARTEAIEKMVRFLRYHFQDNAVFFGENINDQFQSATIKTNDAVTHWKTAKNKYYKLGVVGTANSMELTTEKNEKVQVTSLNNVVAKDYLFAKLPTTYKNVDGTGAVSGTAFNTSLISTSSSIVVHQVNNILTFED